MIPVSKPYLPPIDEYIYQIERIYKNEWLTNRGQLTCELEEKIQTYLGTKATPIIMNNGTIPLQIALKLLGGGGEIITTPFSYVATTSTIVWEGCTPIFVDIDPTYWTIDEKKIEAAITEKTTCILATHVFGNPCDIEALTSLAKKHKLALIFDAAHCFGSKYKGESVLNFGDVSSISFHATKLFHTIEGGALVCNSEDLFKKMIKQMRSNLIQKATPLTMIL
jgi:dTDP-4-amino-4,6-dideoxygalactose transaminase